MENYDKIKVIGKSNNSKVYLVENKSDQNVLLIFLLINNQQYALKRIPIDSNDVSFHQNLKLYSNEISLYQQLNHPNIIKYHNSFITKNKLNILMEYADNGDLSHIVLPKQRNSDYFSEDQIMLSDFGISKQLSGDDELAKTTLGTPYYISPEMCQKQPYNYYTDIWQIGCFLYELTTLNKPFQGDMVDVINQILHSNPKPISSQYSAFLNNLIFSMLQKLPSKRPTIEQLVSLSQIQLQFAKLKQNYNFHYFDFPFPEPTCSYDFSLHNLINDNNLTISQTKTLNRNNSHNSYKKNNNNIYNYLEKVKQCISPVSNPITPQYISMNSFLKTIPKTPQLHSQGVIEVKPPLQNIAKEEPKLNLPKPSTQLTKRKKNLYSKSIYIDLKNLEQNDNKKTPNNNNNNNCNNNQLLQNQNNIPTEKVQNKVFSFADVLFNPKAPTSPNRKICMTNFLKDKIGEIKFEKVLNILQKSVNPLKTLEEEKKTIEEILGDQAECASLFKILITNSTTPSGVEQNKYSSSSNFTEFKFNEGQIKNYEQQQQQIQQEQKQEEIDNGENLFA